MSDLCDMQTLGTRHSAAAVILLALSSDAAAWDVVLGLVVKKGTAFNAGDRGTVRGLTARLLVKFKSSSNNC